MQCIEETASRLPRVDQAAYSLNCLYQIHSALSLYQYVENRLESLKVEKKVSFKSAVLIELNAEYDGRPPGSVDQWTSHLLNSQPWLGSCLLFAAKPGRWRDVIQHSGDGPFKFTIVSGTRLILKYLVCCIKVVLLLRLSWMLYWLHQMLFNWPSGGYLSAEHKRRQSRGEHLMLYCPYTLNCMKQCTTLRMAMNTQQ